MYLNRTKLIIITVIAVVADVLLAFAVFMLSYLGGVTLALGIIFALLAAGATMVPVIHFLNSLKSGADKIETFLDSASAGHLDNRMEIKEEDPFSEIATNLNILMDNLDKMSTAKSDFLASMSHEIRTPMSAIIGMVQIAQGTSDEARKLDCMKKIEDNSKHLLGVINDILDFSKIDAGRLELDEHLFSLKERLAFIESMFQSKVEEKGLNFELYAGNIKNDGIITDSLRLNQVLINLLSNAVKFTDAGGTVTLSVEELANMNGESIYSFSVSDTGIGIDPEQARKLFTPFMQAEVSTAKHYGGTGLGLVISKNIVEQMGGDIELDSRLGEGSIFSFTIRVPSQPEYIQGDDSDECAAPDLTGRRVLIVDDIDINREIAVEILRESGIEMETASNGSIAYDMFTSSPVGYYDMILMDMQMPVMGGCEATEEIRATGREDAKSVKIIAVTANVMRDDIEKAHASGMDGHIGKPIDFGEAYKIMSKMLK
ncbi:MAG: response regulator [Clostridiales Family XIII bacterium]|jgi:signal transduction histidine kinase|nr:response regulator [Clostridiales Family XIII bacterium]